MAFQCSGGTWSSRTKSDASGSVEVPDGSIVVDAEDASTGSFLGTHISPAGTTAGLVLGRCSGSVPGRIEFDRRTVEGTAIYNVHYWGDFDLFGDVLKTTNGRYQKRRAGRVAFAEGDRALAEDDGTWNGEKPIT